jgi:RimJ/RimL family protein N-acetyltransferase
MITTRILHSSEYPQYARWLKRLDTESRATYFGIPQGDDQIDRLVNGIIPNSAYHHFLVAEYKGQWIGCIHMAESAIDEVEFGVIVDVEHRGHGIADRLMSEAIVWCRNRGYRSLYMHCLSWNLPIKHLCSKHGLLMKNDHGETETKMPLLPADLRTITQEMVNRNKNVCCMLLQSTMPFLTEVYG